MAGRLPKRPYPGLRPFAVDEWEIFFGREIMTEDVVRLLLRQGLVLVHGSSGSGKSSLVYAGVLPQLERRRRRRKLTMKTAMIRPGRSPLRSLAVELAKLCASPTQQPDVDAMHQTLVRGREAREEIEAKIRTTGPNELCIFIDQFEELFRFAREGDPEQARIFADVVIGLAGSKDVDTEHRPATIHSEEEAARTPSGIFAVLTMRSEFLGDCTRFPGLAETINSTQYLLPNMSRADLRRAIREPAALYGGSVDWELAEQLAQDAAYEADPLPLIQHTLMRLWERRSGKALQLADYVAASSSPRRDGRQPGRTGLAQMLASHADEILAASPTPDQNGDPNAVEYLFRALTDIDTEGRAIRRPQTFARLSRATGASEDALSPILDAFRADGVSFVTPYQSKGALASGDMIDISHEALICCWPRIADPTTDEAGQPRGWLHREFQDGLIWRSLAVQAQAFLTNPEACLDPATTEQRWPWFEFDTGTARVGTPLFDRAQGFSRPARGARVAGRREIDGCQLYALAGRKKSYTYGGAEGGNRAHRGHRSRWYSWHHAADHTVDPGGKLSRCCHHPSGADSGGFPRRSGVGKFADFARRCVQANIRRIAEQSDRRIRGPERRVPAGDSRL